MLVQHFISCKDFSGVATNSKNGKQNREKENCSIRFLKKYFSKKNKD